MSDGFRQPVGRPSAGFCPAQSRVPRSGFAPAYVALVRAAPSLSDASTAREGEAASTLTLPPKRRGREQAACWQLLRFAAGLTRPGGTSARVPWQPSPVETTHPHGTEPPFGGRMVAPGGPDGRTQWLRPGRGEWLRSWLAWSRRVAAPGRRIGVGGGAQIPARSRDRALDPSYPRTTSGAGEVEGRWPWGRVRPIPADPESRTRAHT